MENFVISTVLIFCALFIIVPFFSAPAKVFVWAVYYRRGVYRIAYLDSMHEIIYISKYHEVNGSTFETSSKEEACQTAIMLNTMERINIAKAKANEWKQVNC